MAAFSRPESGSTWGLAWGRSSQWGCTTRLRQNRFCESFSVPEGVVRQFLLAGLTYLLVQYIMLVAQLFVSYDLVLRERLAFRREDDLAAGRQKVGESQRALNGYKDQRPKAAPEEMAAARESVEKAVLRLAEIQKRPGRAERKEPGGGIDLDTLQEFSAKSALQQAEADLDNVRERHAKIEAELRREDPIKQSMILSLEQATDELLALQREDPAQRTGYRKIEIAIDVLRVVPPGVFAVLTLTILARSVFS
ncbi:MAG: hypothetical protein REJ23_07565 [Brevundimonas sp.]|nr:hypothetical protein [Brevundimonas sp.]